MRSIVHVTAQAVPPSGHIMTNVGNPLPKANEGGQPPPLILMIEDEKPIRNFLKASLSTQDYKCVEAATAREGLSLAASHVPDLVILDLGLPDGDGVNLLRQLRSWSSVPVVILSARGSERDKIEALDAGADDYLTKPFGVGELLARVRVALRHSATGRQMASGKETVSIGDLHIDLAKRTVRLENAEVHLTPIEYRLLACLARNAGRVLTHNFLLEQVWGPGSVSRSEYLRVFMGSLRRKIESDPADPKYIRTEIGVGYRLREDLTDY